MDPKRVQSTLNQIRKLYGHLLDDTHSTVIHSAIESVKTSKENYDRERKNQARLNRLPTPWGYVIHHNQPLRFLSTNVPNSVRLQVDIYCEILWTEDDLPVKQDIKVRVWSDHTETIFDPERDAEDILDQLGAENRPYPYRHSRVVSRIHFDKANDDQHGPYCHLQIGGKPEAYELCWHPKKVNVPRLDYQPMDLFLTCQLVAANFFPEQYREIRRKREWREQVIWCQKKFLRQHYEKCIDALDNGKTTLLDVLWGIT